MVEGTENYQTVARFDELPEAGGKEVVVDGQRVCLFRQGGEVFATAAECPHKGAPLAVGCVENGSVFCALHGWEFDLRTGLCKNMPGREVRSYAVRVQNDEVQLRME